MHAEFIKYGFCICVLFMLSCKKDIASKTEEINISGEYYDWTKTLLPESPYSHNYNKTLVVKMFLAERDENGSLQKVYADFDQCLDNIIKLDHITLGIPKIAYLVGWQFNGHDSKYPAWSEVNKALKRKEDNTALQSLKWLMKEAKKYNTTVSLHVNMLDAYMDSPLWDQYYQNDIIAKDNTGQAIKGEMHSGMQSYQISYAREWDLGLAQQRIDALIDMLPELKEAGTIHIDAFHNNRPSSLESIVPDAPRGELSPFLDYSQEDEIATQRKIIRYFRTKGIDVSSEYAVGELRKDPHIGLEPFAWHYNEEALKNTDWFGKPKNFYSLPKNLLTGTVMPAEQELKEGGDAFNKLLEDLCFKLVPWYNKNNPDPVYLSSGFKNNDAVILPVLWKDQTLIAYSRNKDLKIDNFILANPWSQVAKVRISVLDTSGIHHLEDQMTMGMSASIRRTINLDLEHSKVYLITKAP